MHAVNSGAIVLFLTEDGMSYVHMASRLLGEEPFRAPLVELIHGRTFAD
jgi:hypothetical protein